MIYLTGDCHGDWRRFSRGNFPEQLEMTRDDYVIVAGDFGLWTDDKAERHWLDWLAEKSFTLLFVDGNHENFDRLSGDEFETVDFHGGRAHRIRDNIYHLMRGYVFELCGKTFFAFGGARSHDIQDGILDVGDYPSRRCLMKDYRRRLSRGQQLRVNHVSWWEQEMPSAEEMAFGLQNLQTHGNEVDFIVTHCCPQEVVAAISPDKYEPDPLTRYFDELARTVRFTKWYFGHYHDNRVFPGGFMLLYGQIIQVV